MIGKMWNVKCGMRNWDASRPSPRGAFTLFEVILSLMILALLTGAVYSITSAATETSKATMEARHDVAPMMSAVCRVGASSSSRTSFHKS